MQSLRKSLERAAIARWPELADREDSPPVEFRPLLDLTLGDISTDYALRLAQSLRIDPEQAAQQLIDDLPEEQRRDCSSLRGHLNARITAATKIEEDPPPAGPRLVCVAGQILGQVGGLLRMVSAALLQASALRSSGVRTIVTVGGRELVDTAGLGPEQPLAEAAFRSLIALGLGSDSAAGVERGVEAGLERGLPTDLWIYPYELGQQRFAALCRRLSSAAPAVQLRCLETDWLRGIDSPSDLGRYLAPPAGDLAALVYYLSGPQPARSIDWAVPQLAEKANTKWYLFSTVERLSRFAEHCKLSHSGELADNSILRRLRTLQLFFYGAGRYAAVREFIAALTVLLGEANRLFNSPSLRKRLEHGELDQLEIQIIAGLSKGLSDIIKKCCILNLAAMSRRGLREVF